MLGKLEENRIEIRKLDFRLIIFVIVLAVFGVLVVNSATAGEVSTSIFSTTEKQIFGVVGGIFLMVLLIMLDYRKLVKIAWIFYLLSIISLVYILFFTKALNGAHRWIHVPMLGTIQPSEFSKPALLLFLSFTAALMKDKISRIYLLLLYFIAAAPVVVLVLMEPDLSSTIVLLIITFTILFVSGVSYKWVLAAFVAVILVGVLFMIAVYQEDQIWLNRLLKEHQVERINGFFFPDRFPATTYQQNSSVMAIGGGGLFGKGLNTTSVESVKNGDFLVEEQCDFIFAVVGEELGFIGASGVILLVALIVFECFLIAARTSDLAGKLIAAGTGASLGLQSFINIGVSMLLIPNTGIPLPFVSAGLSSLLSSFIMVGLTLSVSLRGPRGKKVFY
ncbi:MAG: FtsW/RodA/SpoVE family cell cycle protein [Lachnospiraceae bacterium]|nr:FtsW/RodA/SpoVE family cell cycle protein [Lachnospiraceae bacterium]